MLKTIKYKCFMLEIDVPFGNLNFIKNNKTNAVINTFFMSF